MSKLKNREEFEGGLEKKARKRGEKKKKKRVIKHTLNYLYEAKNPQKQGKGRILEGGGGERIFLVGHNIYPCIKH